MYDFTQGTRRSTPEILASIEQNSMTKSAVIVCSWYRYKNRHLTALKGNHIGMEPSTSLFPKNVWPTRVWPTRITRVYHAHKTRYPSLAVRYPNTGGCIRNRTTVSENRRHSPKSDVSVRTGRQCPKLIDKDLDRNECRLLVDEKYGAENEVSDQRQPLPASQQWRNAPLTAYGVNV